LAIYDRMSGRLSRWYFELRLQEECERSKRYGLSLTVFRLKVQPDNSKPLAERLALASPALESLTSKVRGTDLIASLGETEIAICLVQCDFSGAALALPRLLEDVEHVDWQVGLAIYPDDGLAGKHLLELALDRFAPWKTTATNVQRVA
jgi:GGDEF domain-containing protein